MALQTVRLGAIDLNLLVVFDAVMRERSVTRAGKVLGLSQSAMSHALARLRHMLKDELFIRGPNGMMPTPRAEELGEPVRQALDGLRHSLEPAHFDASSATRTFNVAVDNYAALVLVGPAASRIGKTAPGVTVEFRPSGTVEIVDRLDSGEIDLAIGIFDEPAQRFSRERLLKDELVVVLRKDHPALTADLISIEAFAGLPHLEISSAHHPTGFIDEVLSRHQLARRIALHAPLLSAVAVLGGSDMVAIFPRRIAEEWVRYRPLTLRPLPIASPIFEIAMIWPRRFDNQATHRWLRRMIGDVSEELRV
jgi:DNA-binding transcriptional LysR family regulator